MTDIYQTSLFGNQSTIVVTEQSADENIRQHLNTAFTGFVGNADAVHTLKRALFVALRARPVAMDRNLLLVGSASTGKTDLSKRTASALGLPFIALNGGELQSMNALWEILQQRFERLQVAIGSEPDGQNGRRLVMPPCLIFVDECHDAPRKAQQQWLTFTEMSDRRTAVDIDDRRVEISSRNAAFVFATTRPDLMDKPLRSRFTEVPLARYSVNQVAEILKLSSPDLDEPTALAVARAARAVPRVAKEMLRECRDEMTMNRHPTPLSALPAVRRGRGVLLDNGFTVNDVRYLRVLRDSPRPVSARQLVGALGLLVEEQLDDLEPYLIHEHGCVQVTPKGRAITMTGKAMLSAIEKALSAAGKSV